MGFETQYVNLNEGKYVNRHVICVLTISHWSLLGYLNFQVTNMLLLRNEVKRLVDSVEQSFQTLISKEKKGRNREILC